MRKVVYGGATSLDQMLARSDGAVDWLVMDPDAMKIMGEMWPRFDVMLMGRKTFTHSMEQFSEEDLKKAEKMKGGMRSVVFSTTLEPGERAGYEIVNTDAAEFVRELKKEPGKDIMVMGGGELAASLFEAGLIDEVGFNIQPVVLGTGIAAFRPISRQIDLELIECKVMKSGCVYVLYRVKN
ncbi:MAG: dihydrofolate reductase [Acidobacteria bacterium]|nr:dihydrofolate reductase [Acidobacteriota bacterium]